MQPPLKIQIELSYWLRIGGGCAIITSTLVFIGWMFAISALTSIFPGMATMKPQTALAFLLIGFAMLLVSSPEVNVRRIVIFSAVLAALIGILASLSCSFARRSKRIAARRAGMLADINGLEIARRVTNVNLSVVVPEWPQYICAWSALRHSR